MYRILIQSMTIYHFVIFHFAVHRFYNRCFNSTNLTSYRFKDRINVGSYRGAILVQFFFQTVVLGYNTEILFRCHSAPGPSIFHRRSFVPCHPYVQARLYYWLLQSYRDCMTSLSDCYCRLYRDLVRVLNSITFFICKFGADSFWWLARFSFRNA